MIRLATEMGMVLAFPKRRPSTETPIKGTAGPEIVSASEEAVIRSRQVIECRKSRTGYDHNDFPMRLRPNLKLASLFRRSVRPGSLESKGPSGAARTAYFRGVDTKITSE